ncbi:hypothetical protein Lfu02_54830 [Longispora fulva]|nr:hypothetical protein Lfu02_54830 [Longispora fulva]
MGDPQEVEESAGWATELVMNAVDEYAQAVKAGDAEAAGELRQRISFTLNTIMGGAGDIA